jgi:hypothetical protein
MKDHAGASCSMNEHTAASYCIILQRAENRQRAKHALHARMLRSLFVVRCVRAVCALLAHALRTAHI